MDDFRWGQKTIWAKGQEVMDIVYCAECGKRLYPEREPVRQIVTYSPEGKKVEYFCLYHPYEHTKEYMQGR